MSKHGSVYLLLGPEQGEKRRFIAGIQKNLEKSGTTETSRLYVFDTDLRDVDSLLRNVGLFSSHRLVILNGVEQIKKKTDVSIISDYCANPNPEATLIMTSDETRVDKGVSSSVSKENSKIFWELFENQKKSWVFGYFKNRGMRISAEAADLILDLVENNTDALEIECARLATYLGEGKAVELDDVERLIYHSKTENVFTLFDALSSRDFTGSLEILRKILLSAESAPIQLLAGLLWQFRKLLQFRRLIDSRYGTKEAFSKINVRGKRNQATYTRGAQAYSTESLEQVIVLISQYDHWLRSTRAGLEPALMEMFLYRIAAAEPVPQT